MSIDREGGELENVSGRGLLAELVNPSQVYADQFLLIVFWKGDFSAGELMEAQKGLYTDEGERGFERTQALNVGVVEAGLNAFAGAGILEKSDEGRFSLTRGGRVLLRQRLFH